MGFDSGFHVDGINFFNNKTQAIEEMTRVGVAVRILVSECNPDFSTAMRGRGSRLAR
jgi:hypothetical protein